VPHTPIPVKTSKQTNRLDDDTYHFEPNGCADAPQISTPFCAYLTTSPRARSKGKCEILVFFNDLRQKSGIVVPFLNAIELDPLFGQFAQMWTPTAS
jgi:hypothetical protein